MDWAKEERYQLGLAAAKARETGGDETAMVGNRAVELVAARGGTMTTEAMAIDLETTGRTAPQATLHIRQHLAAQGATVAKLQNEVATAIEDRDALYAEKVGFLRAKQEAEAQRRRAEEAHGKTLLEVATLRVRVDACEAALMDAETDGAMWEAEAQRARAEVERLAAELQRMTELRDGYRKGGMLEHDRAEAAESRLAAIRERATQVNALGIRVAAEKAQRAHRDAAHRPWTAATDAAVSWVLEGDAPQETKRHE